MQVLEVLTGHPEPTPAKTGMTGHFKRPADTALHINALGLAGDTICDLEHHGGVDQAVYLFGEPDRLWWADFWDRALPPGYFGENLLISGLESQALAIGDVFSIGDVTLQVTSPRIPCATFVAHVGHGQAIKQFYAAERPGAYARVLTNGVVAKGDRVDYRPYDGDRLLITHEMRAFLDHYKDQAFLERALNLPAHYKLHALARERLG